MTAALADARVDVDWLLANRSDVTAVCTTCRKRQPAPQHVRCKRCCDAQRIRNKRYRDKQKLLRLPRRRPDRLVIRGETRIERCGQQRHFGRIAVELACMIGVRVVTDTERA